MDLTKRFNKQLDKIQVSLILVSLTRVTCEILGSTSDIGEPDFTTPDHVMRWLSCAIDQKPILLYRDEWFVDIARQLVIL